MSIAREDRLFTHPDYYLSDGNIIIVVKHIMFKVYRGLLSKHSTYFSDLFHPLFPANSQEHRDGVPVVRLEYDDPTQLTATLNVIMDVLPEDLDLTFVCDLLPFTSAFGFTRVHKWAEETILQLAPLTLQQYNTGENPYRLDQQTCAMVVRASTSFGIPQPLPLAYYYLAAVDWDATFSKSAKESLSEDDYQKILIGRSRYHSWAGEALSAVMDVGQSTRCSGHCEYTPPKVGNRTADFLKDPLSVLNSMLVEDSLLCKRCIRVLKSYQERLFGKLPWIFQVELPLPEGSAAVTKPQAMKGNPLKHNSK